MSELISIIIPIYNVEKYLRRCIDSVISQTYQNIEIILVDDGSPDKSGEICDEYKVLDKRVKVIHKKNAGLSDARNAGIDIAKGKFLTFVDSDDWIECKYIEKLYQLIKIENCDISMCNFIKTSNVNIQINNFNIEIFKFSNIEALEQLSDKFYVQMVIACGKLYKKELFDNIRFPVGRLHEDEFTTYKLIHKAEKIVFTTEPLLYYWQRQDSIMGVGFNLRSRLDAIDALEERAEYFRLAGFEILSNKTYRTLFSIYREVFLRSDIFEDKLTKVYFVTKYKNFKKVLRKSEQTITFKLFYELFYLAPKTTNFIYKIFLNLMKMKKVED